MCRGAGGGGFYQQRDRLKIMAFNLRLSFSRNKNYGKQLPDSLTLLYLPRISGTPLEINNEKINSNSPAFVTLHRLVSPKNQVVFASRERVRVGEGVRFQVYLKEEKMLKGVFRKDDHQNWKLDCKCELEEGVGLGGSRPIIGVKEAEVTVVSEGGHVAIEERVEMVVVKRRRCNRGLLLLEEIPEEREEEFDYDEEMDGCDCSECCCGDMEETGSDGGDCEEIEEMEMEGVRWAVDVGIWVMCLGVGYLVSKASTKSLRRKRFL